MQTQENFDQDYKSEDSNTDLNEKLLPDFVLMLVCPITNESLEYDSQNNLLISKKAGVAFPVKFGVAILIKDQAIPIHV